MAPNQPKNRGELLALLGGYRAEGGEYKLNAPCPTCGATKFAIDWEKSAGIGGTIIHDPEDGDGCELTTLEAISARLPEPPPSTTPVDAPPVVIAAKAPVEGIQYVRFRDPVSCGDLELQSWSRAKHADRIALTMEPPTQQAPFPHIALRWRDEERLVPWSNVSYVARKRAP